MVVFSLDLVYKSFTAAGKFFRREKGKFVFLNKLIVCYKFFFNFCNVYIKIKLLSKNFKIN